MAIVFQLSWRVLCLASVALHIKWGDGALLLIGDFNFSESLLILIYVLLQSLQETLGMLGSHDNTTAHLRLSQPREDAREVEHEVGVRVSYEGEVGVNAYAYFWGESNLYLWVFLFFHFIMFLKFIQKLRSIHHEKHSFGVYETLYHLQR